MGFVSHRWLPVFIAALLLVIMPAQPASATVSPGISSPDGPGFEDGTYLSRIRLAPEELMFESDCRFNVDSTRAVVACTNEGYPSHGVSAAVVTLEDVKGDLPVLDLFGLVGSNVLIAADPDTYVSVPTWGGDELFDHDLWAAIDPRNRYASVPSTCTWLPEDEFLGSVCFVGFDGHVDEVAGRPVPPDMLIFQAVHRFHVENSVWVEGFGRAHAHVTPTSQDYGYSVIDPELDLRAPRNVIAPIPGGARLTANMPLVRPFTVPCGADVYTGTRTGSYGAQITCSGTASGQREQLDLTILIGASLPDHLSVILHLLADDTFVNVAHFEGMIAQTRSNFWERAPVTAEEFTQVVLSDRQQHVSFDLKCGESRDNPSTYVCWVDHPALPAVALGVIEGDGHFIVELTLGAAIALTEVHQDGTSDVSEPTRLWPGPINYPRSDTKRVA